MKKIIILCLLLFLLTGCLNVQKSSYEDIIKEVTNSKREVYNTYRKGYKFYLPNSMYVADSKEYNEVIKTDRNIFYLYIDLISYLNKKDIEYSEEKNIIYSKSFKNGDKLGYLKIKDYKNDKYLVEIVYNYAKIEVIVDKSDVKNAVAESIIILSSISYNDSFLNNLSSESLLNYKEEVVDIFNKGDSENNNGLEYADEEEEDIELPDRDLIN